MSLNQDQNEQMPSESGVPSPMTAAVALATHPR